MLRVLSNPFAAIGLAAILVLIAASLSASRLTIQPQGLSPIRELAPEHVAIMKRSVAAVPQAAVPQAPAMPANTPQIARTGKMSLYVGNLDKAAAVLAQIARQNGGDVFSSDLSNGDAGVTQAGGQMQLRVPADRFDATLDAVSHVGKVRERSTSAQDLSGDITDSDARLRNLRQTEADIRHIMDRSGSVAQIMDAENQLSQVREQIETLEAELKSMRSRVAYATIDVDMQAEAANAPVQPTAASQLASAWRSAIAALSQLTIGLLAAALWFAVFVPYLVAAAVIAWVIYSRARRLAP